VPLGQHSIVTFVNYTIPGMVEGCYNIDSLLLSTLQCFYDTDSGCVQKILQNINKTNISSSGTPYFNAHSLIYNQTLTHFTPNLSFSLILEDMMIEQWNISLSFDRYYQICTPMYCTYTEIARANNFIHIIITLISMIGGLIVALRIIISHLVQIIFRLFKAKSNHQPRGE
jgi:hypothetical protein